MTRWKTLHRRKRGPNKVKRIIRLLKADQRKRQALRTARASFRLIHNRGEVITPELAAALKELFDVAVPIAMKKLEPAAKQCAATFDEFGREYRRATRQG